MPTRWAGGLFIALAALLGLLGHALLPPVAARGPLVLTRAVGPGPVALALDPRSEHAVITTSGDHTVRLLDARSGRLLRTIPVGQPPTALAIAPSTARLFVASPTDAGQGDVRVLDVRRGTLVQTVTVPDSPLALAVDERAARVLVLTSGSNLSILDAHSGTLQATVPLPLGQAPAAVAVDARSGHAFVTVASPHFLGGAAVGMPS